MQFLAFLIGALVAVYGAVQTVRARNPIHSALYLVLNFVALAYLFLLLYAPFLAMVQVAVYAGAIMVLFLFIIMYMNLRELPDARVQDGQRSWGMVAAALLGVAILASFITSPGLRYLYVQQPGSADVSVASVGVTLLRDFAFPFEVASVLLLVAIIGVMVVARRSAEPPGMEDEETPPADEE